MMLIPNFMPSVARFGRCLNRIGCCRFRGLDLASLSGGLFRLGKQDFGDNQARRSGDHRRGE